MIDKWAINAFDINNKLSCYFIVAYCRNFYFDREDIDLIIKITTVGCLQLQ